MNQLIFMTYINPYWLFGFELSFLTKMWKSEDKVKPVL